MKPCIFCDLDTSRIENTLIEETKNFYVIPALGSLVSGYILVVTKEHYLAISCVPEELKKEYEELIQKYREVFKKIYGKYPIVFEHGTPNTKDKMKANSVEHAHVHIVNHQYKDENNIIKMVKLEKMKEENKNCNYIKYISNDGKEYITYNFEATSQLMRKFIADDLNMSTKYDWKNDPFIDNIKRTIQDLDNIK